MQNLEVSKKVAWEGLQLPCLTKASCSCTLLIPCVSFILPVFPCNLAGSRPLILLPSLSLLSKWAVIKSGP